MILHKKGFVEMANDLSAFFKKDKNKTIFIGDTLEAFIPDRYSNHGMLDIKDTVHTLGVFDIIINGTLNHNLVIGGLIDMAPSSIDKVRIDKDVYHKLTFKKGDVFVMDDTIVQQKKVSYVIFYEMILGGHYPRFMDYNKLMILFDKIAEVTGDPFHIVHAIYEMLIATLARNPKDPEQPYRNTSMKAAPLMLPLRDIARVAKSTTAKILGSYMNKGIDTALAAEPSCNSELEDMLRR